MITVSVSSAIPPPLNTPADVWTHLLEPLRLALIELLAKLDQPTAYVLIRRVGHTDKGRWFNSGLRSMRDFNSANHENAAEDIAMQVASNKSHFGISATVGDATIPEGYGVWLPTAPDGWVIVVQGTGVCQTIAHVLESVLMGYLDERDRRIAYAAAQAPLTRA